MPITISKAEILRNFPHTPPTGYSYDVEDHNTRTVRIIMWHHYVYDFNLGKPVKTIWGFYNPKKKLYYAPINYDRVGEQVDIKNTTKYTAMPLLV